MRVLSIQTNSSEWSILVELSVRDIDRIAEYEKSDFPDLLDIEIAFSSSRFSIMNQDRCIQYKSTTLRYVFLIAQANRNCFTPECTEHPRQQLASMQGGADTVTLNVVAERTWNQANEGLCSVLLLTTPGSASATINWCEDKRPKHGAGHGQAAWEALTEQCSGHRIEVRKAYHETLFNTKMGPSQDPHDLVVSWTNSKAAWRQIGRRYTTRGTRA